MALHGHGLNAKHRCSHGRYSYGLARSWPEREKVHVAAALDRLLILDVHSFRCEESVPRPRVEQREQTENEDPRGEDVQVPPAEAANRVLP